MQPDDKQASRLDILTAAANLFSELGYNGTSFAAVANAAAAKYSVGRVTMRRAKQCIPWVGFLGRVSQSHMLLSVTAA